MNTSGSAPALSNPPAMRLFAADAAQIPFVNLFLLAGTANGFDVLYPILPRLGVTAFGMGFGRWCIARVIIGDFVFGDIRAAAGIEWVWQYPRAGWDGMDWISE